MNPAGHGESIAMSQLPPPGLSRFFEKPLPLLRLLFHLSLAEREHQGGTPALMCFWSSIMKHPAAIFALLVGLVTITFSLAAQQAHFFAPKAQPVSQESACPNDDEETCWVAPEWRD